MKYAYLNKTIAFFLVVATLTGCSNKNSQTAETGPFTLTQITGIGKVIPEGGISGLAAPVSGIVTDLPVNEGSRVKKGEILVQLDNTDQSLALNEINSKIITQQKTVESQKWLIEQKKNSLADKQRKLTDAQELLKSGATSGENVRTLQNDLDMAGNEMKKAESDLAVQQSLLEEAIMQKAARINDLEQTALRAPMDGVVLDILPKKGESVSQFQTYGRMAPDSRLIVVAEFDEMFASKLAPGQKCQVRFTGETISTIEGSIVRISADLKKKSLFSESGDDLEDRRVREAEISLDKVPDELLINTKVECIVQIN